MFSTTSATLLLLVVLVLVHLSFGSVIVFRGDETVSRVQIDKDTFAMSRHALQPEGYDVCLLQPLDGNENKYTKKWNPFVLFGGNATMAPEGSFLCDARDTRRVNASNASVSIPSALLTHLQQEYKLTRDDLFGLTVLEFSEVVPDTLQGYNSTSFSRKPLYQFVLAKNAPWGFYASETFYCSEMMFGSVRNPNARIRCYDLISNDMVMAFSVSDLHKKTQQTTTTTNRRSRRSRDEEDTWKWQVNATFKVDSTSVHYENLNIVSLSVLRSVAQSQHTTAAVKNSIDSRDLENRVYVAFLWVMLGIANFCVLGWVAILQCWLGYPKCLPFLTNEVYAFRMWMFHICILLVVSGVSGLAGFIFLNCFYFVLLVVLSVVYLCKTLGKGDKHNIASVLSSRELFGEDSEPVSVVTGNRGREIVGEILEEVVEEEEQRDGFNAMPNHLSIKQSKVCGVFTVTFILFALVFIILVFGVDLSPYYIVNRGTRESEEEVIPQMVAKLLAATYAYEGFATRLKMNNILFDLSTQICDEKFKQKLSNAQKEVAIKQEFIDKYAIDMSLYVTENYTHYDSVNDWFIRKIKPELRQLARPRDDDVIVSMADSRMVAFEHVLNDQRFWIKSRDFSMEEFLTPDVYVAEEHNRAAMIIFRLSPQDYHRFHMPVSGRIEKVVEVDGGLHSVGRDGMTSGNGAIYNSRVVVTVRTEYGLVNIVAVGATCVASIKITQDVGAFVGKGQELGYFQFGGSTIVLVFPSDTVNLDADLLERTEQLVESYGVVRSRVAKWKRRV